MRGPRGAPGQGEDESEDGAYGPDNVAGPEGDQYAETRGRGRGRGRGRRPYFGRRGGGRPFFVGYSGGRGRPFIQQRRGGPPRDVGEFDEGPMGPFRPMSRRYYNDAYGPRNMELRGDMRYGDMRGYEMEYHPPPPRGYGYGGRGRGGYMRPRGFYPRGRGRGAPRGGGRRSRQESARSNQEHSEHQEHSEVSFC